MARWEYLTLASTRNYGTTKYYVNGAQQPSLRNGRFEAILNQLGNQGWELVGISADGNEKTFIFKRMCPVAADKQNGVKQPAGGIAALPRN